MVDGWQSASGRQPHHCTPDSPETCVKRIVHVDTTEIIAALKPRKSSPALKSIATTQVLGRSYVVYRMAMDEDGGHVLQLKDVSDGTEYHIGSLARSKNGTLGGLTLYRQNVPSALIQ